MIVTIRFLWDYYAFPVWAYDENHRYVEVEDIEEFQTYPELYDRFANLQRRYDGLFLNSPTEFRYEGFKSDEDKQAFCRETAEAVREFIRLTHGRYRIQNDLDIDTL